MAIRIKITHLDTESDKALNIQTPVGAATLQPGESGEFEIDEDKVVYQEVDATPKEPLP